MRTVGIDLAVKPADTGIACIDWRDDQSATVTFGRDGRDGAIIEVMLNKQTDVVGIDVPLGWPTSFVAAVSRHQNGGAIGDDLRWDEFYQRTRLRETDRWLKDSSSSASPISVSMDKIGATAMRGAWLLSKAARMGSRSTALAYQERSLRCTRQRLSSIGR